MPRSIFYCVAVWFACAAAHAQSVTEIEPNDLLGNAMAISSGVQIEASIAVASDVDVYQVTLSAPGDILAWTGPGAIGQIGDTQLLLLDATGLVLADVNDGPVLTFGFYSEIKIGGLLPGLYYLTVIGFLGSTGTYSLDVVTAPLNTYINNPILAPVAEQVEPNDPRIGGQATATACFTLNTGSLSTGGGGISWTSSYAGAVDYDVFSFIVPAAGVITLFTDGALNNGPRGGGGGGGGGSTGGGPITGNATDTVLHLFDSQMQRLAFDDDSGKDLYSQIVYTVLAPGIYYTAVNGFGAAHVGAYRLTILGALPPLPLGLAQLVEVLPVCQPVGGYHLGSRLNAFGFLGNPELPLVGSTLCLDVTNAPTRSFIISLFDFALAAAPFQGPPLSAGCRLDLPPATMIVDLRLSDANGYAAWPIPIPFRLSFIGSRCYFQTLAFDFSQPQFELLVSNRCDAVFGVTQY